MRLITPKRLKENEAFMWRLADRTIDEFAGSGACEFVTQYAGPFAMLVVADLLGVPEEDHDDVPRRARPSGPDARSAARSDDAMSLNPLEFLYQRFTAYVEDRRREPRDDVLTGLATATFPDGSTPEVIDVVRIAANLFAAGQETTVRLLATALLLMGERPGPAAAAARRTRPHPELRRGGAALREPDQGRLPACRASRARSAASTSRPAPR